MHPMSDKYKTFSVQCGDETHTIIIGTSMVSNPDDETKMISAPHLHMENHPDQEAWDADYADVIAKGVRVPSCALFVAEFAGELPHVDTSDKTEFAVTQEPWWKILKNTTIAKRKDVVRDGRT